MKAFSTGKFPSVKPRSIRLSPDALVTLSHETEAQFPLVVRSNMESVNPVSWLAANVPLVEEQLRKCGAILLRGFHADSIEKFEQCVRTVSPDLIEYGERSSPRTKICGGVYTSTDHPPDQHILLHNEQSYTLNWPMKIWFFCVQEADRGGHTPIADSRKILGRLSPATVERFTRKQVMYVRNYGDGLGLPWQEAFQTNSKTVVEEHCRRANIEVEWKEHQRLRTWQVRPAIRRHPQTHEAVWFNHAFFFHLSSLEETARETILSVVKEEDVPFNTFYGDGSAIEPSVLEDIGEAYEQESVSFAWQKMDILLLDNMLVAHGRQPYTGPRKIVVAMSEPFALHVAG